MQIYSIFIYKQTFSPIFCTKIHFSHTSAFLQPQKSGKIAIARQTCATFVFFEKNRYLYKTIIIQT